MIFYFFCEFGLSQSFRRVLSSSLLLDMFYGLRDHPEYLPFIFAFLLIGLEPDSVQVIRRC